MAKEIPMLFSTPMVQALLAGTKNQTRRIPSKRDKIQPGDIIWVRETTAFHQGKIIYKADFEQLELDALKHLGVKWIPSLFMKREHRRIFLKVKAGIWHMPFHMPLQNISGEDAINEGIECVNYYKGYMRIWKDYLNPKNEFIDPVKSFRSLWESINGKGSWDKNPIVIRIEFKKQDHAQEQTIHRN